MRRTGTGILVMAALAVFFACGMALAAEGGRRRGEGDGDGNRRARQPKAAEAQEKAPAAEEAKPAEAAETSVKAEGEASAQTAEGEGEEGPTLEKRLKALQNALEEATAAAVRRIPKNIKDIVKYLPNKEKDMVNPETGKPIKVNEAMLGKSEQTIAKPKEFITFYADAPTGDRGTAAIFGDGTIKYLNDEEFKKALAASVPAALSAEDKQDRRETGSRSGGGRERPDRGGEGGRNRQ
jgi:hypothetical protein